MTRFLSHWFDLTKAEDGRSTHSAIPSDPRWLKLTLHFHGGAFQCSLKRNVNIQHCLGSMSAMNNLPPE